ncbi:hypothetical protein [Verrucosispora sioxanthis]|uniref:hypothetical protein n=1 Tax=Verrucosispora sioxanthis TaxID=2499994 RepID=UPI001C12010D|nr:hypothetical protein [Verrucosispora sioxanthis]
MAQPAPEAGTDGKLVWAPDEVAARIRQEVTPEPSLPSRVALAVLAAFVLTWPPTFVVFALATLVAPAATDEAGVGRVALWSRRRPARRCDDPPRPRWTRRPDGSRYGSQARRWSPWPAPGWCWPWPGSPWASTRC